MGQLPQHFQGRRKDDTPVTRIWVRSERLFEQAGSWHINTREGTIDGPYGTKFRALQKLDTYIGLMQAGLTSIKDNGPGFDLIPQ